MILGRFHIVLFLFISRASFSQSVDTNMWITNGDVNTLSSFQNRLYIGGSFDDIGPRTGNLVQTDINNGTLIPGFPRVYGEVNVIERDQGGNLYIGGLFSRVGNYNISNLVRIFSNGMIDLTWVPNPDGRVRTIAINDSVFIGGDFLNIGGSPYPFLAAIDSVSGQPIIWNPSPNNTIYDIFLDKVSGQIYLAGAFTSIFNTPRFRVARLYQNNPPSGFNIPADNVVRKIKYIGGKVYICGDFNNVGINPRKKLAVFDWSGNLLSLNLNINNRVLDFQIVDSLLFVCGEFSSINIQPRNRVALINLNSNSLCPFNPVIQNTVRVIKVVDTLAYIGGDFLSINGSERKRIGCVNINNSLETSWDPHANNSVNAILVGPTILLGGQFTSIGGNTRNNLCSIDLLTGIATSWNPSPIAAVNSLLISNDSAYVGGLNYLSVFNTFSGLPIWTSVPVNGTIRTLCKSNNTLYCGGYFDTIAGFPRQSIAALNASSSSLCSWNPKVNGTVNDLEVVNNKLYVAGYFTTVTSAAGVQGRNRLVAFDTTTGIPTSWNPNANNGVYSLLYRNGGIFLGGFFSQIGNTSKPLIALVDTSIGSNIPWAHSISGLYVKSLALNGDTLLIGGNFYQMDQTLRTNLGAININSNSLCSWSPDVSNSINCLCFDSSNSYFAGGIFNSVNSDLRPYLVKFSYQFSTEVSENESTPFTVESVYPNPFTDNVYLSIGGAEGSLIKISQINYLGELMAVQYHKISTSHEILELTLISRKPGIYFLVVENANYLKTFKLIRAN